MTKIPVPTRTIIIKGIDPIGISGVGMFFIKSKFPGNDHTVSKKEKPANIITSIMMMKIIIPSLDLFTNYRFVFFGILLNSFEKITKNIE